MSADVLIVAPVLNRPQNARALVESLESSSSLEWCLLFVCSPNDHEQQAAVAKLHDEFARVASIIAPFPAGSGDYARKIQVGYDSWMGDRVPYVLCAADDLRFHPRWDTAALTLFEQYDVGVVGTNDLANPQVKAGKHATHPIVSRCYIDSRGGFVDGEGQIYFDGYDHQFVDVELVETAKARGCFAHAHESHVEHLHPLFNHSVSTDATYRKGRAKGKDDAMLLQRRKYLWLNEKERV